MAQNDREDKNIMKKKVVAALLLSASLLIAGCGDSKGAAGTEKKTEAAATEAVTEKKTEAADKKDTEGETKAGTEAETETGSMTETKPESVTAGSPDAEADSESSTDSPADEVQADLTNPEPEYTAADYVKLGEYKDLTVEYDPAKVSQDEIDSAVKSDVTQNDKLDEVTDSAVEEGDIVNIDYEGSIDGELFDGGSDKGADLTIGSGAFIPGFEEGIIGMKAGETKDVPVTFPEQYNPDVAGKDAVFKVTVNSIKRMPTLTDELVSAISEYKTVDEYTKYIESVLLQQKESQIENQKIQDMFYQIYKDSEITGYPEDVIDYRLAKLKSAYEEVAEKAGLSLDEYIQKNAGVNEDEFDKNVKATIQNSMTTELILKAIAEKEDITVPEDEYQKALEDLAASMGGTAEDVLKLYSEQQIKNSVLSDKVIEYLKGITTFTEAKENESEAQSESQAAESETEAAASKTTEAPEESEGPTEAEAETTAQGSKGPGQDAAETEEGTTESSTEAE